MAVLVACTGTIYDRPGSGGSGPSATATGDAPLLDSPGALPLRRLTRDEYSNTILDLFGVRVAGDEFASDAVGASGFYTPSGVSDAEVRNYLEASEKIGSLIASRLPGLVNCSTSTMGEEACARQFFKSFGRRVYRRPIAQDESEHLVAHFKKARTTLAYSFYDSVRLVLQGMLQSPHFLYHHEFSTTPRLEDKLVKFDSYAMASRLSYFLWSSMPDEALLAAAEAGGLQTAEEIERETRRMMGSSKFRNTLRSFHFQWLGIDELPSAAKDSMTFPQFTESVVTAMQQETTEFASEVIINDGRLATLLTAPFSFISKELAPFYKIPVSSLPSNGFNRVSLDSAQRSGLLTQLSFLTLGATNVQSLPPKRGLTILERFLCRSVPPPPADVPPPPPPKTGVSNRERFEAHMMNGCAKACHGLIDPLGFAFEHYDAVGVYRTEDANKPVNASGSLMLLDDQAPVPFNDAIGLTRLLADNDEVRRCVGNHWFRFALGRASVPGDAASFESAYRPFVESGGDLRELIVAITKARSFLYRATAEGEVLQ